MDVFGIVLSVPAGFVASVIYSWLLNRFVAPHARLRAIFRRGAVAVLGLLVIEIAALLAVGAVRLQRASGGLYYRGHWLLYILSVPALANLLTLRNRTGWLGKTFVIGVICAVFTLGVVLMEYGVYDAIFGPE